MSRLLPLFPLPVVLFPGTPLPLHIFEPRYRTLLADCMDGDRRFGIIFSPEAAGEESLAAGSVGCVARIESAQGLPDGRSNIVVAGQARFALERFVDTPHPYHVGEVADYEDEAESSSLLDELSERVRGMFTRVARAARTLADDPDPVPPLPDDPAQISFNIASMIDLDGPQRQLLLVSRSPAHRLRELESLLGTAVSALEARAQVHLHAKSNGHGPSAAI
ncbi:MAG TPA: LON peptidase substrate-binding domain-containing protein [Gemmatimonadaceae bacterium]|nr:LON peptidase substrate-binding domain-containing protein [Gemmatimonadaceae bacterium]